MQIRDLQPDTHTFSKLTQIIEMAGPIFCDVFMTERLLLSFVDLKIILNRSTDTFSLMASEEDADHRIKLNKVDRSLSQTTQSSSEPERL